MIRGVIRRAIPCAALATLLALPACAPGSSTGGVSAPVAFTAPRSQIAATDLQGQEAIADAVESVDQLLEFGRAAYQADPSRQSAEAYCRSGELAIDRGALRQAIRDKSKALYVSRQTGDPLLSAECARSIAIAYSFAGLNRRALDWTNEAERYLQQAGPGADPGRAAGIRGPLLKVRADDALAHGDSAKASAFLAEARAVAPAYYQPYILVSLAQIDLAQGRLPAAEAELDAAIDLAGVPDTLNAIIVRTKGEVALAGRDLPGAAALFAYATTLSAQTGDSYGLAWAERGRAQVEQAAGRPAGAAAAYGRAVQAAEQSRVVFRAEELRSGAFGALQAIFDEAVDTFASQGRWQEAFDLSERGRARSLRDLLRDQSTPDLGRVATARDVQAALPPGTALVSYHMLAGRLLIWTLRQGGLQGVSVPVPASEIDTQVRRFTALISRPGQEAALDGVARSLFATLVAPAALRTNETIVFEPYGILHNLAFAGLRDRNRWLIEDHEISEVLSADSLVGLVERPFPPGRDVVIFANPDGSLPAADKEASAIAKLLPGATVLSGAQASRQRFQAAAATARVLHVATHADFDPVDPLSSRIRLAGADLAARDVYTLPLGKLDLLVLSACETSIGAPSPGDEVIGFNRSFLTAGARNLISTLWAINDQATALLMAEFYVHLSSGPQPATIRQALRQAQLDLLHNPVTASPVYWAAFTLTGSAGRQRL